MAAVLLPVLIAAGMASASDGSSGIPGLSAPSHPEQRAVALHDGASLQVLHLDGPARPDWLAELRRRGVLLLQPWPGDSYLVWTDARSRERLAQLLPDTRWLRYSSPLYPYQKLAPALDELTKTPDAPTRAVDVAVRLISHPGNGITKQLLADLARNAATGAPQPPAEVAWTLEQPYERAGLRVHAADVQAILLRADVVRVELISS